MRSLAEAPAYGTQDIRTQDCEHNEYSVCDKCRKAVRLNIGAGSVEIPGFVPIDRKLGTEGGDLSQYADNSVDEIRASHILEHFSFAEVPAVLAEWHRVLKPGGRCRIAVPDVDYIAQHPEDPKRLFYLMGGQSHEDDYHRSAYDKHRLQGLMLSAGFTRIQPWESQNTDCAALPCSLNLEGYASDRAQTAQTDGQTVKIAAYMTLPRYQAVVARQIIEQALKPLKIELVTSQGVFYGQCMQRMFEQGMEQGVDWILAIDSDSLFTAEHLSRLCDEFALHPECDALAALQCRRGKGFPLMTIPESSQERDIGVDGSPIVAATAHFGLTLIRAEALQTTPKPWFYSEPDENGEWGDERMDDDIWFWHQWRKAGHAVYVTPKVSIGHLEETVAEFDEHLNPRHVYVSEWRERYGV